MQNYSAVVSGVLATYPTRVVPADQEEDGKAQLTRQAAWEICQENPNIGLMSKTSGNNVHGLTVDVIMDKSDGSGADIASSRPDAPGFVEITSVWSAYPPNSDPAWLSRWVAPTAELADLPGPLGDATPEPQPPDPPVPPKPPVGPMPPMPTEWSAHELGTIEWWTDMCPRLDAVYCNLLTAPGAPLRHADYGGWGNWVFHIREEKWTVAQVSDGIKQSDEYKAIHQ